MMMKAAKMIAPPARSMPNMDGMLRGAERCVCDVQHPRHVAVVTRSDFYRPLTRAVQPWGHAEQALPLERTRPARGLRPPLDRDPRPRPAPAAARAAAP